MATQQERERIDRVNDRLRLIQYNDGLTFGTDALLLAAYINRAAKSRALELGGGTGIISLLLAARGKVAHIECVEIQSDYAALIARNAESNGLADKITVRCADLRDYSAYGDGEFDLVFSNPPYMRSDGAGCKSDSKQIARHEVCGGIGDFAAAAAKKLRWGGRFFCVWRPDRLSELFSALTKNGLEPKRMTLVHASSSLPPSMLLLEAKRGGMPGMRVTRPLLIGGDLAARADSPDMCHILNEGSFPHHYE